MKQELEAAVSSACKELFDLDTPVELTRPDEQFGDFATNAAMQLAGKLGQKPRDIAETLATKLREQLPDHVDEISVAGPGFLNLTLTDTALHQAAQTQPTKSLAGQKVLTEYSDPNPFKPLHAGHLYTTLVGDTIARLLERGGAETVRLNYGGDVGLHVGKSMWAIIEHLGGENPEKLEEVAEAERPAWLGARYTEGHRAYSSDDTSKQEIIDCNKRVYELHSKDDHDSPFAQIYWTCRKWSYDYFKVLYEQLEVTPFDRFIPESEVTPLGVETVQSHVGDVYVSSDGAIIFDGEKYGLHKRVFINSEGLPTYETKDVGLSLTKWQDYHFDQSIIITASEQAQYMQVVIKSIEQFAPEPAERTRHLTHGTLKLRGGVKMSSREGNVVTALDILEAARRAGQATGTNPDEHTILAAVKYAFAKHRIGSDIIYDPEESVALEGNSGPYLQYAHARARSILRRAAQIPNSKFQIPKFQDSERSLTRKIGEHPEVVERAVNDLMPHHICTYLYELAQQFNSFYEHNRVIGDPREAIRLGLVESYADTLKDGLNLLGIHAPDRL